MKTTVWTMLGGVLDIVFRIALIIVAVYFIRRGAVTCYDYGYRIFNEPPVSAGTGRDITVTVPVDCSARDMANDFEEKGLTRDHILFFMQYYASEYREDLKGGTYTLSTSMTAEEMFAVMAGAKEYPDGENVATESGDGLDDLQPLESENGGE